MTSFLNYVFLYNINHKNIKIIIETLKVYTKVVAVALLYSLGRKICRL